MAYTYRINALDVNRWLLVTPSTYIANVTRERQAVKIPGRDGEIMVGRSTVTPRVLTLTLLPGPTATDDADAMIDDLTALLSMESVIVQRVTPTSTREAVAEVTGHSWDGNSAPGTDTPVTVSLTLPGVYWRDTTAATTALVAGSTALDVGSAPVTDAVVRFALDAANPVLTDAQTGTGISVAHDAVATDYIYVDCGQLQAWKSASSSQWTRPSSSAAWLDALVSYPGPGPLRMTPAVTESGGMLSRLATLTSSHTASVRFKKAWW